MASPQEPIREILEYSRDWANTPEMRETAEAGLAALDVLEARVAALTQALEMALPDLELLGQSFHAAHKRNGEAFSEDCATCVARAALRVEQEGEQ